MISCHDAGNAAPLKSGWRSLRSWQQGIALASLFVSPLAAQQSNDDHWRLAADAYQAGRIETGHLHLKSIVTNPSIGIDDAIKCLQEMLKQARRSTAHRRAEQPNIEFVDNPSAEYAAQQLCALERMGAISANHYSVQQAVEILLEHHLGRGRYFEAREMADRFTKENPHDLYWRIQQAYVYRKLQSSEARTIFEKLEAEMDLDHPDPLTRDRWVSFNEEFEKHGHTLPPKIWPLPVGSPLPLMEPDDPDGEWGVVVNRPARGIPEVIDRLAARSITANLIVPWRDAPGLTNPARALDLHLLNQPPVEVAPLRKLQEGSIKLEQLRPDPSESEALSTFRRYPWSHTAQEHLLELANRTLFAGRPQSALRSFQNLLEHSIDDEIRKAAQVGKWTAHSQISPAMKAEELLGESAPDALYPWLGKPARADEVCRQLSANNRSSAADQSAIASPDNLVQHVIHLPPVAPWSSPLPGEIDLSVHDHDLLISGRDLLALYDTRHPGRPLWISRQPPYLGGGAREENHPGYFRPQFAKGVLYTRWGYNSQPPRGMAGLDRSTGELLWNDQPKPTEKRLLQVPLGDPVPSDGLLYYLQWTSPNGVNQGRGRRLNLTCFDPHRRAHAWNHTIAQGGQTSDHTASLERAQPASAIYGNRVSIHDGAVYSNSNCGIIARSDIRDGRTDWVFHYQPIAPDQRNVHNHGSPPLIAGNLVICMPRDTRRIFALDRITGRLAWDNSMMSGVQLVGVVEDLLVVRGKSTIAGLDLKTGEATWYQPTKGKILGRVALSGSAVCLAQLDGLHFLNARSGRDEGLHRWNLSDERPLGFAIEGRHLYLATDKPGDYLGRPVNEDLNPSPPSQPATVQSPLVRSWSLPRENARITIAPLNADANLQGSAFVYSQGILERLDLSRRGRIRWQRFTDVQDPKLHLVDRTLLLIDYAATRGPGLENRVVALNAMNGRLLWEHVISAPVQETLNCGGTQIFHDRTGRIIAVDLATGRRAWERNFGNGFQMRLSWDGSRMHIFFVSRLRAALHQVVDAPSGRTIAEHPIAAKTSADARNAKAIKGGYYEVTINPARARYFRLTALSEVNGRGWASISELQAIGEDGRNLPRRDWAASASNSETKARYDTRPVCAIDDDPVTWWHSQWLGSIPPHPHSVTIDMGTPQTITGIRYLPAVIVNNNGMIGEYELHLSMDGQNWGTPAASGFLVNQTRVDHAYASENSIVFESRASPNQPLTIFRYPLDGSPALLVQRDAQVLYMRDPYFITTANKNLVVRRFDDPAYHFQLGPPEQFDLASIELENDRLILGRKGVLVADLAQKRFIVPPSDGKLAANHAGVVIRDGAHSLLKIVSAGEKGQTVTRFDLLTGQLTETTLTDQTEAFQTARHSPDRSLRRYEGILLLNDSSTVSAWLGSP